MTDGPPIPPPDAPPPPPPPPGAPPGAGEDSPDPQPPERRVLPAIRTGSAGGPLLRALRDAAELALDALDYAGDRVAERVAGVRRRSTSD